MVQTWILDEVLNPVDSYKNGMDRWVCGYCKRRSPEAGGDGSCYVNLGQAPLAVWKKFHRIHKQYNYNVNLEELGKDRIIRLGAYGDPGMIDIIVWDRYLSKAKAWTGYTHMWKNRPSLKKYCMASVDTLEEAIQAQDLGWRTFRVYKKEEEAHKQYRKKLNEAFCPSSNETKNKVQCINCPGTLSCDGTGSFFVKKNILIKEH